MSKNIVLSGVQSKIYQLIISKIKKDNTTDYIDTEEFYNIGINPETLNGALRRLKNKKVISIIESGNGRGNGYRKFKVLKTVSCLKPKVKENKKFTNIYFFADIDETVCKIGESQSVRGRLNGVQTGNDKKLIVLRVLENVPITLEKEFHEEFDHLRTDSGGEWFHLTPELKNFITYVRVPKCISSQ